MPQGNSPVISRRAAMGGMAALALAPAVARAAREGRFDSAGVPIRFIEEGEGEPVVMIHGYTSTTERQFVETGVFGALAARYRTIALDARGHGQSGKPHDRAQYGVEMGRDITRLMDHLGLQRAHILGYSMGAHVVAQLLVQQPDRFLTATLGGASGRRNWSAEDQQRVDVEAGEMDEGLLRSQFLRLWPKDRPPPTEEQIREDSRRRLAGQDPKALAAVRRSNPDQVVTEAQMAAVTVPTLGIVGTADPYSAEFEALKRVMPQLELVTIPGASHGSAPGTPQFREALLDFLRRHPARA